MWRATVELQIIRFADETSQPPQDQKKLSGLVCDGLVGPSTNWSPSQLKQRLFHIV